METYITYEDSLAFVRATGDTNLPHYAKEDGGVENPVVSGFLLESLATSYMGVTPPFTVRTKFKNPLPVDSKVTFTYERDNIKAYDTQENLILQSSLREVPSPEKKEDLERIMMSPCQGETFEKTMETYKRVCETAGTPPLLAPSLVSGALLDYGVEAPAEKIFMYVGHDIDIYAPPEGSEPLEFYLEEFKPNRRGGSVSVRIAQDNELISTLRMSLLAVPAGMFDVGSR